MPLIIGLDKRILNLFVLFDFRVITQKSVYKNIWGTAKKEGKEAKIINRKQKIR